MINSINSSNVIKETARGFSQVAVNDELLSKLSSGSLTVKDSVTVSAESGYATAEELTEQLRLDNITVTVIQ